VSAEETFGGKAPVAEVELHTGKVARTLQDEFPGLALRYAVVQARSRRSPADVKMRLRYLANRMHGQRALGMRREPIPSAYRIFFRHIGLDPDKFRTPLEEAVLERLRAGGFKSEGLVDDALTIATVETGVAMRALDADRTKGKLGLRLAQPDERLGADPAGIELPEDALVLADQQRALGLIFGETAPEVEVQRGKTERVAVCAIQVGGVPDISVEEAIWTCAGVLRDVSG
jgi:DNA/RNA-binding domain of Phe-tRNA-synthetase-like protein